MLRESLRVLSMSFLCGAALSGCSTHAVKATSDDSLFCAAGAQVTGVTLLQSHNADPADLIAFIRANWFAMDEIAVAQGVLVSYDLLAGSADSELGWNVAVLVGYPSAGGYADVREAFEKIRSAHQTVAINGLTQLSDFGRFVLSEELALSCK